VKSIIPLVGLGTYRLQGKECEKIIQQAFDLGYRHIDTADVYENHAAIGKAIQRLPREDLFLATKIPMQDLAPSNVKKDVPRFLKELKTDYIDLLLIHWPNPGIKLHTTLDAMMTFVEKGLVKHIGVSNFVRSHLKEIAPYHFPILTNQIELHPYLQRKLLVAACKKMKIAITAYRPLAKGAFEDDPTLKAIGEKYGKTPSQIALRWLVQQDIAVIPKAGTLRHLKDNIDLFDFSLTKKEMTVIEGLDQNKKYCLPPEPIED
jgi:2,5-diketo-D-gluconate reductase B